MSELTQEKLTKEEWHVINNLLSYQPDEELGLYSGKDAQNMTQFMVDISIGQAAAKIVDKHETEDLCGRFEQLNISTKFKHRSVTLIHMLEVDWKLFKGAMAIKLYLALLGYTRLRLYGHLKMIEFLFLISFMGKAVLDCQFSIIDAD